jgi:predicted transcriptional regulator
MGQYPTQAWGKGNICNPMAIKEIEKMNSSLKKVSEKARNVIFNCGISK